MIRLSTICMSLALGLLAHTALGQLASESKEIVVLLPGDLPEIVQQPGQSMDLHPLSNGHVFLYIEQEQVKRLAILDVTDPSHITALGIEHMDFKEPFDFVRPLGSQSALVCFRDDTGSAIVDYRNPRHPNLISTQIGQAARTDNLGSTALLVLNAHRLPAVPAQDYQVVDTTYPDRPRLLTTVPAVVKVVKRDETGTTFLLGSGGLTVIRQPHVESEYRASADAN